MKQVKWGIIGLGNMALKFAEAFKNVKNAKLFSISSKSDEKIEYFKKNFGIDNENCFQNYEDLLKSENTDIVYIALPNSFHYKWIIECIENKKNILVEKPATINLSEIEEIQALLFKKNLFFSEAFMYLYHPQILKVINLLNKNSIGKIISMESFFGVDILTKKNFLGFKKIKKIDKENRLFKKDLGGGVILDLGCYPVSISTVIAKLLPNFDYKKIKIHKKKLDIFETGVDIDSYAELDFGNDFKSNIGASFKKNLGLKTKIKGTSGELIIENTWNTAPSFLYLNSKNEGFKKIQIDSYENVYSHEIETLSKCILENKREPDFPGFTINDTLENMKILDKWLN